MIGHDSIWDKYWGSVKTLNLSSMDAYELREQSIYTKNTWSFTPFKNETPALHSANKFN